MDSSINQKLQVAINNQKKSQRELQDIVNEMWELLGEIKVDLKKLENKKTVA